MNIIFIILVTLVLIFYSSKKNEGYRNFICDKSFSTIFTDRYFNTTECKYKKYLNLNRGEAVFFYKKKPVLKLYNKDFKKDNIFRSIEYEKNFKIYPYPPNNHNYLHLVKWNNKHPVLADAVVLGPMTTIYINTTSIEGDKFKSWMDKYSNVPMYFPNEKSLGYRIVSGPNGGCLEFRSDKKLLEHQKYYRMFNGEPQGGYNRYTGSIELVDVYLRKV